ncbi:MAG: hypothetical protein HQL75_05275 [Magnetococcales bacterium]|nr:hypothetical protein [Magnetococcales bacterium]
MRRYQNFLISTLFMLSGLFAVGYSEFYSPYTIYATDAAKKTSQLKKEIENIGEKDKQKVTENQQAEKGIHFLPDFLGRINDIAHRQQVIINRLSPEKEESLKFKLEMTSEYRTFIKFIAQLESLNVIIDDIQLHPYDARKVTPVHAISFTIIPRNDAEPLSAERQKKLQELVAKPGQRNPFQRLAPGIVDHLVDLTWVVKLGGIGVALDGKRYATIDNSSYRVGDTLEGRVITEITESKVFMEKIDDDGVTRFVLSSREKKKGE